MLNVYIEGNAFAEPQPVEVSADALIAILVPALVSEFSLPQTDLAGKRLVYRLRRVMDGQFLPNGLSLREAAVQPGTRLALDACTADELLVPAGRSHLSVSHDQLFYADRTLADSSSFPVLGSAPLPAFSGSPPVAASEMLLPDSSATSQHRSRRAFLLMGGAVLGVAGAGLGYAAYRSLAGFMGTSPMKSSTVPPVVRKTASTSPVPFSPTKATMTLMFSQHHDPVHSVAWSPSGTLLASGSSDRLLLIWNVGGQVQTRLPQDGTVHALAWSPDSLQLAAGATNQVLFLNAQTGTTLARSTHTHHSTVTTLSWSSQLPQFVVSGGLDKLAVVWNTQTFQAQTRFRLHTSGIVSSSWASSGGTVATSSEGGVVRVWEGASGQQVHGFFSDDKVEMTALAFEPAGTRLAAGGVDGVLRLWQNGLVCQLHGNGQQPDQCLDQPTRLHAHTHPIRAIGWSPDGRFLASADDHGMLFLWSPIQSQTPLFSIPHAASILALSWSPDGRKLATASGKQVFIWQLS